jgi:GT2 family glycosyltransferase
VKRKRKTRAVKKAAGKNRKLWRTSSSGNAFNEGFDTGYNRGYNAGRKVGSAHYHTIFEGTSIIIPTFNQKHLLAQCLQSIKQYTPEPHEIIVIDNGSTDGTADLLQNWNDPIRYKLFPQNLGFAGGVNQGLLMARGRTLLILNNDTVVTHQWLANLLKCLQLHGKPALVGPVTNYISGPQQIAVPYQTLPEMQEFARNYNSSAADRKMPVERLTGFCVLMDREVFQRLGYFDEGFQIGNCEDDDYGLRARLIGCELIIDMNTFIHHVGSQSIGALGPQEFSRIYEGNLQYYSQKWGQVSEIRPELFTSGQTLKANDFYPDCIVVCAGEAMYWVEHGVRRPIVFSDRAEMERSQDMLQPVRLSRLDLKNWAPGEAVPADSVQSRLEALRTRQGSDFADGMIVRSEDGSLYQWNGGKLRRFLTPLSFDRWNLRNRYILPASPGDLAGVEQGLPIIAPPVLLDEKL